MDLVFVLYDERRLERYHPLMEELERQGITNFEFFPAITDRNTTHESINASFKEIVKLAKEREQEYAIIWEDDVSFYREDGFKYFMSKMPESFDLYIGGTYLIDNRIEYKEPVVKVDEYVGNHCIIIHSKYFDKFLESEDTQHIDVTQNGRGDFYVCWPMAAYQRAGYSSNNKAHANYHDMIKTLPETAFYK